MGFSEQTWVEVSRGAIAKNFAAVRDIIGCGSSENNGEGGEVIAVVKSDAYGHGACDVARVLLECGCRRFAVASIAEAVSLRRCALGKGEADVLVLGYTPPEMADEAARHGITLTVCSVEHARAIAARGLCGGSFHLAVDSGMHRVGIPCPDGGQRDADDFERRLSEITSLLRVSGAFTHLAAADGADDESGRMTERQISRFWSISPLLDRLGISDQHILNSAGILYYADRVPDRLRRLVRPGLMLYGLSPRAGDFARFGLVPSLCWYARIAKLTKVRRGESIGYGMSYIAPCDMTVAVLPVGYADGFPRALSNGGQVLLRGHWLRVVGKVCMNMTCVDVSDVAAKVGEIVTLIGGDAPCDGLAAAAGTISYEILSRINPRLFRIYKD